MAKKFFKALALALFGISCAAIGQYGAVRQDIADNPVAMIIMFVVSLTVYMGIDMIENRGRD